MNSNCAMPMIISLIICTYNRATILEGTMPYLLGLIIPDGVKFELIFVDNNSNDNTKSVIYSFIETHKNVLDASYEFEIQQGLSYARNKGYSVSKGDYVAYIDDECMLSKEWLTKAVEIIVNEAPAFLGGPYYGKYFPEHSSNWYLESFGDSYLLQHDLQNGPLEIHYLSGGNIFIRKDVFDKVGLFDIALGMNGNVTAYGEEVELQKRMLEAYPNEVIYYESKLFVWHCIRKEKMKIWYLFKDSLIRGYASAELQRASFKKIKFAPVMLVYYSSKACLSFVAKFFSSLFTREHFFTLLYEDCKNNGWSNIGRAWFRTKLLLRLV